MNPSSDTPRVKEFLKDKPPLWRDWKDTQFLALEVLALELERELSILKSKREAAVRYGAESLESDSIENSCNCLARTPEAHLHKPGCKYRLISERDAKQQECERLKDALETARNALRWMVRSSGDEGAADALKQVEALTNK